MEENRISSGTSCFLIRDKSFLNGWDAPFYQWLRENGFSSWGKKGVYDGVDWVYVNLTSKLFAPGLPGCSITSVVGEHAVTLDEFKQIHAIFAKYDGLDSLRMSQADQREWNERKKIAEKRSREFWESMTYDQYVNMVVTRLIEDYNFAREVAADYMKEEEQSLRNAYQQHWHPAKVAYEFFMTW